MLYVDPELLPAWEESDAPAPSAARWTVFRDPALRDALLRVHQALAEEPDDGLAADEAALRAVDGLRPHLRPVPQRRERAQPEHPAVRRAAALLRERWNERIPLAELAIAAGLSRFELVRRFRAQTGLTPHASERTCGSSAPGPCSRRVTSGSRRRRLRVRRPGASHADVPSGGRRHSGQLRARRGRLTNRKIVQDWGWPRRDPVAGHGRHRLRD